MQRPRSREPSPKGRTRCRRAQSRPLRRDAVEHRHFPEGVQPFVEAFRALAAFLCARGRYAKNGRLAAAKTKTLKSLPRIASIIAATAALSSRTYLICPVPPTFSFSTSWRPRRHSWDGQRCFRPRTPPRCADAKSQDQKQQQGICWQVARLAVQTNARARQAMSRMGQGCVETRKKFVSDRAKQNFSRFLDSERSKAPQNRAKQVRVRTRGSFYEPRPIADLSAPDFCTA